MPFKKVQVNHKKKGVKQVKNNSNFELETLKARISSTPEARMLTQ